MAAPTKEIAVEVVKSGQMLVMEGISIQLCRQGHEGKRRVRGAASGSGLLLQKDGAAIY